MRSKGATGCNEELNIIPLCRNHHVEQHRRGIITFVSKYPSVWTHLKSKGWELTESAEQVKLWHPMFLEEV